jgi:hypothetical protein
MNKHIITKINKRIHKIITKKDEQRQKNRMCSY